MPTCLGLLLIALGVALIALWLRIRRQAAAVRQWPPASGVVVGGELRTLVSVQAYVLSQGGLHPRAEPRIEYEYQVEGRTYRSDKVRPGTYSLSMREAAQLLKDHAPGTPVTAYYDPANPHRAVLHRAGGGEWGGIIAGVGCAAIGLALLLIR